MSQKSPKYEVPRDLSRVQELRREISRNSAEISINFWQEFENIRTTQRNRMAEESLRRERLNNLMRDGQEEANKEAEALGRSISAQGMITLPPPLPAEPPAPPISEIRSLELQNFTPSPGLKKQGLPKSKAKSRTKGQAEPSEPSPVPSIKGRLSATPKATPGSSKSSANTSKLGLTKKTKK